MSRWHRVLGTPSAAAILEGSVFGRFQEKRRQDSIVAGPRLVVAAAPLGRGGTSPWALF